MNTFIKNNAYFLITFGLAGITPIVIVVATAFR